MRSSLSRLRHADAAPPLSAETVHAVPPANRTKKNTKNGKAPSRRTPTLGAELPKSEQKKAVAGGKAAFPLPSIPWRPWRLRWQPAILIRAVDVFTMSNVPFSLVACPQVNGGCHDNRKQRFARFCTVF